MYGLDLSYIFMTGDEVKVFHRNEADGGFFGATGDRFGNIFTCYIMPALPPVYTSLFDLSFVPEPVERSPGGALQWILLLSLSSALLRSIYHWPAPEWAAFL